MNAHANFKSLQESVNEDWQLILSEFGRFAKWLPDRVIAYFKLLEGGFPVDRIQPLPANGHPRVT
jgi:hypothetical protein